MVAIWVGSASMVKKLTKQSLPSVKPRSKPYIEYDADLGGFGVAVYPSGVKSWVCEYPAARRRSWRCEKARDAGQDL